MKHILFFFLIIFFLTACKKEEKATLYMSGIIYNNCYDREPLRNYSIRLYRNSYFGNSENKVLATGSTDNNGYFKLFFPPDTQFSTLDLQSGSGYDIMINIPPTQNWENAEIFGSIYANISVSLNVINPHNLGDTLIIGSFSNSGGELKIPCPLTSGHLYTATNWSPVVTPGYPFTVEQIAWDFIPSTGVTNSKTFNIDKYCQDTVYVTVDIE